MKKTMKTILHSPLTKYMAGLGLLWVLMGRVQAFPIGRTAYQLSAAAFTWREGPLQLLAGAVNVRGLGAYALIALLGLYIVSLLGEEEGFAKAVKPIFAAFMLVNVMGLLFTISNTARFATGLLVEVSQESRVVEVSAQELAGIAAMDEAILYIRAGSQSVQQAQADARVDNFSKHIGKTIYSFDTLYDGQGAAAALLDGLAVEALPVLVHIKEGAVAAVTGQLETALREWGYAA